MIHCPVPVIGFCAYSGTGKTTLLTQLIPLLKSNGLRVGMIKHAHHSFDIDHRGKDSYRLRQAGTQQILIASERYVASVKERPGNEILNLQELIAEMDVKGLDIILVEGFKHYNFPKIELHRPLLNKPLFFPHDNSIIAIATDGKLSTKPTHLPILDLNDIPSLAEFIHDYINSRKTSGCNIALFACETGA